MRSSLLIVSALVCASMAAATAEIHDAAKAGDRVRIQTLVEKDPQSVNARDENGRTPLHWACREGKNEIVEFLISRGAEVRIADNTGATPLHAASALDDAAAMKMLMDRGADPNARDLQGKAPLNVAATNGAEAAVRLLIERKADLENRDDWGRTPLIAAAREKGGVAVIRALLDAGASIDATDKGEDSALQLAAWRGYADVVNLLLERGAEVPITGQAGATLLNFGVSRALDRLFLVMVRKGADLNTEAEGSALLRAGASGGSVTILKVLIEKGQKVNDADENGWSPLHFAVDLGRTEAMDFLLTQEADANARTLMGQSAYNIATENGDKEIAALLAARGADKSPPRFPVLKGSYMGQKEPGKTPELFAGGIVSARYHLHSAVAFSPDGKEAMWSVMIPGRGSGYGSGRTLVSRLDGGRWTYPTRAQYGGVAVDDVPIYSPGSRKLYDMANRTLPGGPEKGKESIWVWERSQETWTKPKPLEGFLNDVPLHWQFGVDQLDNIYVSTNIAGGRGRGDLFVSKCLRGSYQKPENLGDGVNTASDEGTPFVSPDGRTLLFHRDGDLYASFLGKDGKWGESAKLGGGVNTPAYELCPTLSPDGKHLFFLRGYAVYWVDAGVVEDARTVQLARAGKRSAAAEIEQILGRGDVGTARARFGAMTGAEAGAYFVDEPELITLGYRFLGERKVAEATAVFEMNARAFPDSWNAWDSLAEAFLHSKDREKAEAYYAKSVALNPENQNGKDMLSELRGYKLDAAGETGTPARFPPGAETGLTGPYLGQAPPGLQAKVFAPGIVSTSGNFEFTLAFSPDGKELYFTRREGEGRNTIMVSRLAESGWTAPEEAAFAKGFPSNEPHVTPDGRKLYFGSRRPRPGVEGVEYGIWVVERASDGGWGEPRYHGPGMYVSVARGGNLYMTDVTNVIRRGAIVYPWNDGRYGPPRWLGGGVNAPKVADHMFVAPDEGLILLDSPNRPGGQGGDGDLWVCFRQPDGTWSGALNLGDGVNDAATQFCPTFSPDGKYMFYSTNRDIYWVSAKVLDPLREKALGPGAAGGSSSPIPISRKTLEQKGGGS